MEVRETDHSGSTIAALDAAKRFGGSASCYSKRNARELEGGEDKSNVRGRIEHGDGTLQVIKIPSIVRGSPHEVATSSPGKNVLKIGRGTNVSRLFAEVHSMIALSEMPTNRLSCIRRVIVGYHQFKIPK